MSLVKQGHAAMEPALKPIREDGPCSLDDYLDNDDGTGTPEYRAWVARRHAARAQR